MIYENVKNSFTVVHDNKIAFFGRYKLSNCIYFATGVKVEDLHNRPPKFQ